MFVKGRRKGEGKGGGSLAIFANEMTLLGKQVGGGRALRGHGVRVLMWNFSVGVAQAQNHKEKTELLLTEDESQDLLVISPLSCQFGSQCVPI